MNCINKNCKINNDAERMITCFLCHCLIHYKCSGMPTLVNEAISEYDGLNYFCMPCRKPAVEFYRFFQGTKTRFLDVKNAVATLTENISNYGKLFDQFSSFDNLKSPPKSSPVIRKSSRKCVKDKENPSPSQLVSNTNVQASKTSVTTIVTPPTPTDVLQPTNSHITIDGEIAATSGQSASEIVTNQRMLRIKPARKNIFISRFLSDTTVDEIDYYIKSKLNFGADILIKKFTYTTPRDITSFKLSVPPDLFEDMVNPNFWPDSALVREYVNKENPRRSNAAPFPPRSTPASHGTTESKN